MVKTKLGAWSVGLVVAMFGLIFLGMSLADTLYEAVPAGDSIPQDILVRPALALSMLAGFGAGVSALVTGLISIIKQKERGILVFISTLIGAGLTLFLILEFVFPH